MSTLAKRLLLAWIGYSDFRPMAADQPAGVRDALHEEVGKPDRKPGVGPVRTLVESESFDKVILLSDAKADWCRRYKTWLGAAADIKRVKIKSPTDYESIFLAADSELSRLRDSGVLETHELSIHLSPGSPAMAAVWLLLGKSKYPAVFYQTHAGRHWKTEVPFDLAVDFLPDLYASPDKHLQYLAASRPGDVEGFEQILGESEPIRTAVGRAKRAAVRGVPVLLLGESGVGKEMFAQAIHRASPRADKPFVPINCAAVARELLESELFGHKKGAFTGADSNRQGAFAQADGGTLFLDEVGECDLDLQAKLLRVLQPPSDAPPCTRVYRPVGATKDEKADVRIIAATNRDLIGAIADGRFREDLYYRLAVVTVSIPPLRERKADIPAMAEGLLRRINKQLEAEGEPGYVHKSLSARANTFVRRCSWPGNVRQLSNVLVQAAVMTDGETLDRPDIEAALGENRPPSSGSNPVFEQELGDGFRIDKHLEEIQRHYLKRAMEDSGGVKTQAARLLGMANYQTLDAQLQRLNVTGDW